MLAGLLCITPICGMSAELEVRVISLKHRLPDEVIPVLRNLLDGTESINGHDTRLIVRATPRTFGEIERVLGEIDTRRRNLRISIQQAGLNSSDHQELGASGNWRQGNTRIILNDGRSRSNSGLSVQHQGRQGRLGVQAGQHTTNSRRSSAQSLMVLDGGNALLRVGESIPAVQPYLVLAGNRLIAVPGVQYYDVSTGFEVGARLIGDRIQLQIHPRMSFRSSRGTQTVDFQELRTEVSLQPGEWTDLGGTLESANEVSRGILQANRDAANRDHRLLVRVDPL